MKKKGFTLIELLAVIVILAIIALITVPVTLNIIEDARKGAFEDGLYSIFDAYSYEEAMASFSSIGEKDISSLNLSNNKYSIGKVDKIEGVITIKNVSDGVYCANGTKDNFQIINGNCSNLDETAPEVKNIAYTSTSSNITITVNFSEPDSFIKNVKFRLLDENDNVVVDYIDYDTLSGSGENRVAKKAFNNLEQNKSYKVEVQIENMAIDNNLTTDSKLVQTVSLNKPTISYAINWELSKTVTITYNSNVTNSYKILDENDNVIEENMVTEATKIVTIDNYNYKVIAISNDGVHVASETVEIGYIDKVEPTVNLTKNVVSNQNVLTALPDPITTLSGYTYTWYKDDSIISGASLSNYITSEPGIYKVIVMAGNSKTAESAFTVNGYVISYDSNGGNEEIPNEIKTEDLVYNFTNIVPTKQDYTFIGWSTSSTAASAEYLSNDEYSINADLTLYAVWTPTYICTSGTLVKDETLGSNSGGYICTTDASGESWCNVKPTCAFAAKTYTTYNYSWMPMATITLDATTSASAIVPSDRYSDDPNLGCIDKFPESYFSSSTGTMYKMTSNGYTQYNYTKCTTSSSLYNASQNICYRETSPTANSRCYNRPRPGEYYSDVYYYICARKYDTVAGGINWQDGTPVCSSPSTIYTCASGWSKLPSDQSKCYRAATN